MAMLALLVFLIGMVLGLRFKVLVLCWCRRWPALYRLPLR